MIDPIGMNRNMGMQASHWRSNLSEDEAHELVMLATQANVLEIGSWSGYSAYRMAFSANRVDCVDPYKDPGGPPASEFITNTSMYDTIFLHVGRSADIVPLFQPIFDLVFIDGDHSYEGCRLDLELAFDKVKFGGVIALHDYNLPNEYVERLKDSCFSKGNSKGIGIKAALADFFKVHCNFRMARSPRMYVEGEMQDLEEYKIRYEYRPPELHIVDTLAWFRVNWRE